MKKLLFCVVSLVGLFLQLGTDGFINIDKVAVVTPSEDSKIKGLIYVVGYYGVARALKSNLTPSEIIKIIEDNQKYVIENIEK